MNLYFDKKLIKCPGICIKNNSNDWDIEHNNLRYILNLLLSVIMASIKTVGVLARLSKVE
jgi:predicted helicase